MYDSDGQKTVHHYFAQKQDSIVLYTWKCVYNYVCTHITFTIYRKQNLTSHKPGRLCFVSGSVGGILIGGFGFAIDPINTRLDLHV